MCIRALPQRWDSWRKTVGGKKLHVGCGQVYKPGHINVDKFDLSVADESADALDLPYPDNFFDGIDAEQLIEHLDHIHCKYLLAELYRVLAPRGELVLETPDLEKSVEKLTKGDRRTARSTLHWIYGLDSPGLQHKTGFTWRILKELLEEAGFERVEREKEQTHTYEPGIRARCRKPPVGSERQRVAHLRKHILKNLGTPDSYILVPLEDTIGEIAGMISHLSESDGMVLDRLLCHAAVKDPRLALAIIDTLSQEIGDSGSSAFRRRPFFESLAESGFRGRAASLWMRSRKDDSPEESFARLSKKLEGLLMTSLASGDKGLSEHEYLMSLDPVEIGLFDLGLLFMEARRLFFVGVKRFDSGEFGPAAEAFSAARSLNPWNPFIHWNLARLAAVEDVRTPSVSESYHIAERLLRGTKLEKEVAEEARRFGQGEMKAEDLRPLAKYDSVREVGL